MGMTLKKSTVSKNLFLASAFFEAFWWLNDVASSIRK